MEYRVLHGQNWAAENGGYIISEPQTSGTLYKEIAMSPEIIWEAQEDSVMKTIHFIRQSIIDLWDAFYLAQEILKGEYLGDEQRRPVASMTLCPKNEPS